MKCSILFLLVVFVVYMQDYRCMKQIYPNQNQNMNPSIYTGGNINDLMNFFNSGVDNNFQNYQNALKFFQLLNSFNQMNLLNGNGVNNILHNEFPNNLTNFNPNQLVLLMQMLNGNNLNNNLNTLNTNDLNTNKLNTNNLGFSFQNLQNPQNDLQKLPDLSLNKTITKDEIKFNKNKNNSNSNTNLKNKEEVSDILKDEINQLKQLTKEANNIMKKSEEKNYNQNDESIQNMNEKSVSLPDQSNNFEDKTSSNSNTGQEKEKNGPIKNMESSTDNLDADLNFLQTETNSDKNIRPHQSPQLESKIKQNTSKGTIKPQKQNLREETEEMKRDFEDKFIYLLGKLNVIYQISNN